MPKNVQPPAPTVEVSDIFSRLRSCSRELYALDTRPLVDPSFLFPWDEFAKALQEAFGISCSFRPQPPAWTAKADVSKGLIPPTISIAVGVTDVEGQVTLLLNRPDVERFMGSVLKIDSPTLLRQDPSLFDQFSLFLSAQLAACTNSLPSLKPLSIRLAADQPEEGAGALCQDIEIFFEEERGLARLVMPPTFLNSWRALRLGAHPEIRLSEYSELEIPLSIEAGRTSATPEEIESLHLGDFFVLDHPFYIPGSQKSRVFLTHNGVPLFRAKIQEEGVKILEMPLQHEAFLPTGGVSMSAKRQEPPPPPEETQNPPLEAQEWEEQQQEAPPMTEEEAQATPGLSAMLPGKPVDVGSLPVAVVVQLAELMMSVEKLAELQPGNLLDLDVRPENGAALVVNGKVIGRGELLRIGDSVGVRITEIGFSKPQEG